MAGYFFLSEYVNNARMKVNSARINIPNMNIIIKVAEVSSNRLTPFRSEATTNRVVRPYYTKAPTGCLFLLSKGVETMANTVQIRPELIKSGYTDQDIGYDEGRKMTTLKGQDFLGAGKYTNVAGSTFTDRMNFDNALKKYNQGQQLADVQSQAFNTTPVVNPYDTQIDQLFKQFQTQVQNPTQVNPYGTPQYAAAQAQTNRQVAEGQRQSREGLNRRGIFDSSLTSSQANQIAQEGTEYLNLQRLPQIVQQLQAEQQQKTQGLYQLLNSLMGQQGVFDTRSNNQQTNALDQLDFLTGRQDREQNIQREDESITRATEYQTARDKITDERDIRDFDEDVRRYGLDYAAQEADKKAQRGMEQQRINLNKREIEIREKEATARTTEENDQILGEESRGLAETLRAGEMSPAQASKQIDEDLALGYYTPEQAAELKKVIDIITPSLESSARTPLTDEQQTKIVTGKALDKLYKEQGKGKPSGDWKSWYNDPRGRLVGVDYDTWHRLYGPTLNAG